VYILENKPFLKAGRRWRIIFGISKIKRGQCERKRKEENKGKMKGEPGK
jgi:hypothetical protein